MFVVMRTLHVNTWPPYSISSQSKKKWFMGGNHLLLLQSHFHEKKIPIAFPSYHYRRVSKCFFSPFILSLIRTMLKAFFHTIAAAARHLSLFYTFGQTCNANIKKKVPRTCKYFSKRKKIPSEMPEKCLLLWWRGHSTTTPYILKWMTREQWYRI